MKLTRDEQHALAFIAALLLLSAAVRVAALPEPMDVPVSAGFDADAHIAATERAVAQEERRSRPLEAGERLDPNRASAEELDRLPGVGPVLAARIVAHRESEGPFLALDSLLAVAGIGPATLDRMRPLLRVR